MKIPRTITIAGHSIQVRLVSGLLTRHGNCGHFMGTAMRIEIEKDMPQSLIEETFWHEVVEAGNWIYELKLPHRVIQILGVTMQQAAKGVKSE